ncbi:MAG TPA: ATP-binding protein [Kiritimatiellia bacterium]|nr:ATP-binding protein [Kiritimatiellia bacterium]
MNILVVEDDENSRILQHTILEASGHTVRSAPNGREALRAAHEQVPDLVISDIMMPEMDGYALCRAMKSDPALAAIPFVFYSATYTTPPDQQLALELGGARFLVKPMDPTSFMEEIRSVIALAATAPVQTAPPPLDPEAVDFKYAHTIARKLDKKMDELRITQTKLASTESRLQRIEDSYRMAQRIARIGSWDLDVASGRYWWSDELLDLLGQSSDVAEPDGELLLRCIAPEDRDRYRIALDQAVTKGIPFRLEHGVVGPGPGNAIRQFFSEARVSATQPDSGAPLRVICAMQDITAQRQIERDKANLEAGLRQAQKLQALGTLAGSIAHDFNNILTSIIANAELLKLDAGELAQPAREGLDDILAAGKRATDLVMQILAFCRQQKGQEFQAVAVPPLVEEVMKFVRTTAVGRVAFAMDIAPTCPPVFANPTQLHQVLMNLCINAVHAMRDDEGRLSIRAQEARIRGWDPEAQQGLKVGHYVRIDVSDTGCGMDEATRERIFEPYFTTKDSGEGTGLGLSVVHGIVLAHNGLITVDSAPGKGTTFTVYLPTASAT